MKCAVRLGLFDNLQNDPLVITYVEKNICKCTVTPLKDSDQGKPQIVQVMVPGPERVVERIVEVPGPV